MSDELYDKLANVLRDLAERFPDDAFTKHQRLRGFLSDHLPDAEREIRIALDVVDEGVVDLVRQTPDAQRGLQIDRLVSRLDTSRGIREDIARKIIQAYVFALGKGELPSSVGVAMPQTPPRRSEPVDDWVGVSEAVGATGGQAHASDASATDVLEPEEPKRGSDKAGAWHEKLQANGSRGLLLIAAVVIAVMVFRPSIEEQSNGQPQQGGQPQGGQQPANPPRGQPGGQPGSQPGGQPQSPPGGSTPQVGPTDGLPRVGPGAQPNQQPPAGNGATGTAVWYDDQGTAWSIQYNATQFQGTANTGSGVIGIAGGSNPQTNLIEFQLFNQAGNVIGQGQGQFSDQTHISYVTMDGRGNVIAQGQWHINHAPS